MNIYTVYKITCLSNNKLYIGFTKLTPEKRLKQHFYNSIRRNKNKLARAILKYGRVNFITETIFTSIDKQEALNKEMFFIKEFNTLKKGYNCNEGGTDGNGRIVSEETKKLISANHADFTGDKNPFFNKIHSEATKKLIANREYVNGENHHLYNKPTKTSFKEGKEHPKSQPIVINNVEYGSLTLAAKAFNISRETLKKRYL